MTTPIYSAQNLRGRNPLQPAGLVNLACGALKLGAAAIVGKAAAGDIPLLIGTVQPETVGPATEVVIYGLIALILGIGGLQQLVRGIGQIGTLVVPPRAPADFANYEADLAEPLMRRELPAYQMPPVEHYRLAHRLFPSQFPLLSRRVREQLVLAVSSVSSGVSIALLLAAVIWALPLVPDAAVQTFRPGYPWLVVAGLLGASALRLHFVMSQFVSLAPSVEREEFRFTAAGGGDPLQIPIGLKHELMSLRPDSGAPNRGKVIGFDMTSGGVSNTGDYTGSLVLETQPEIVEPSIASSPALVLTGGVALTLLALTLIVVRPGYVADYAVFPNPTYFLLAFTRLALRLAGALLLLRAARATIGQAEHFLNVFRFRSLGVVVAVQGTFGRAGVKVGKALRDSIESENVVVRSDSAIVGYVARVDTESLGLMGSRYVVSMRGDPVSGQVRETLEVWFEAFRSRGADIVGVDLQSTKVRELVQANVAIDSQRAGSNKAAQIQAVKSSERAAPIGPSKQSQVPRIDGSRPSRQGALPAGNDEQPSMDEEDSKVCPDCAEHVRLAARKCRFCGFVFDSA